MLSLLDPITLCTLLMNFSWHHVISRCSASDDVPIEKNSESNHVYSDVALDDQEEILRLNYMNRHLRKFPQMNCFRLFDPMIQYRWR